MADVMTLYLDDSGTRNPDRNPKELLSEHGHDWFALGGVIVRDADRDAVERAHAEFCQRWPINAPLHSCEIRTRKDNFAWIGTLDDAQQREFFDSLTHLIVTAPLIGIACVIDRPGYNARYREKYGHQRWSLCKTGFNVVVERAAKYARKQGYKLRVYVEKGDIRTDAIVRSYYDELRARECPARC